MPYRKTHPGLDQVMTDEALDAFIDGVPLALEEPPVLRLWPAVLLAALSAAGIGLIVGLALGPYVVFWPCAGVVVGVTAGAIAYVLWAQRQ